MELTIGFVREFDKLKVPVGGMFTTIRRSRPDDLKYYRSHTGDVFSITVNGVYHSKARLMAVLRGPANALPGPLLDYDTDGDIEWINKITRYDEVLVLLLLKCDEQCS